MPAPRIFSTTGAVLSSDELAFAQNVAASFSFAMKRSALKLVRRVDSLTGAIVEYHADKDIAYVTPGGYTDYVSMRMLNPVPYRGASIGRSTGFGNQTYVIASDGAVLASEIDPTGAPVLLTIPNLYDPDNTNWFSQRDYPWEGGSGVRIYGLDESYSPAYNFNHTLTFTVPEDCLSTETAIGSDITFWNASNVPDLAEMAVYAAAFNAGVAENKLRRKTWFKKNSDEFISALKTGFAIGATGVTRPELQLGSLPDAWETQIKRDVDVQYNSYPPANTVGRKTHRDILYVQSAPVADIVQSDTSSNLTQAGVKITKRVVTLQYMILVDGVVEVRELPLTGYLTQTVTRHNNSTGTQVALSRKDVYGNWYFNETVDGVPAGVPGYFKAPYFEDTTGVRIGAVLNGTAQHGYNADSTLGVPGNPLAFIGLVPSYPATYSTVLATAPAWLETWHNDTEIVYSADGIGAATTQNDSALHGVTKIDLTPIGLVANGVGTAAAGESVGMFSAEEGGTQIEIYGTAVYNFDWQTGALTFANWKPLHDPDNGLEVSSKIVDLPQGVVLDSTDVNCLVTYRGLHWPDVVKALRVRDSSLPTATTDADRALYALIMAAKAG